MNIYEEVENFSNSLDEISKIIDRLSSRLDLDNLDDIYDFYSIMNTYKDLVSFSFELFLIKINEKLELVNSKPQETKCQISNS